MRIAVVASLVTPLRPAQLGGAQSFLCDLAQSLANLDHEVSVYCAEGSEIPGLRLVTVPVAPAVRRALVTPAGSPRAPVPELRDGFERLFSVLRAAGPDVVSQHAFDAEAVELAEDLPVLHTLHMPPLVPSLVAAVVRSKARFVTVSEASRLSWVSSGLAGIEVIRNGVPDFEVAPGPVDKVAVIAGRVAPEKGTATALRLAERTGLRPVLAGTVYDPEYHRREIKLPVEALSRRELWKLMARSAVTLMPVEWDEPFGLTAAESQLAGCPVVAYRRGGLPEVVEEGVGGFFADPGDFDSLVAAVPRAVRLDRPAIRSSARSRLLIGPVAREYERMLCGVAG